MDRSFSNWLHGLRFTLVGLMYYYTCQNSRFLCSLLSIFAFIVSNEMSFLISLFFCDRQIWLRLLMCSSCNTVIVIQINKCYELVIIICDAFGFAPQTLKQTAFPPFCFSAFFPNRIKFMAVNEEYFRIFRFSLFKFHIVCTFRDAINCYNWNGKLVEDEHL